MAKLIPIPFEQIRGQVENAPSKLKDYYQRATNQLGRVVFRRDFQEKVLYIRRNIKGQPVPPHPVEQSIPLHTATSPVDDLTPTLCKEFGLNDSFVDLIADFVENGNFDLSKLGEDVLKIGPEFRVLSSNHGVQFLCGIRRNNNTNPFIIDPTPEFLIRLTPDTSIQDLTKMFSEAKKLMGGMTHSTVSRGNERQWPFELINDVCFLKNEGVNGRTYEDIGKRIYEMHKKSVTYLEASEIYRLGRKMGFV